MKGEKGTKLRELQHLANNGGGVCGKCGKKTEHLTVDHLVPLHFVEAIGLRKESQDHDWNFQLLCRPCNRLKGASWDFTDSRTIKNLRQYVDLAESYFTQ